MKRSLVLIVFLLLGGWTVALSQGWQPPAGERPMSLGALKGLHGVRMPLDAPIDSTHAYDVLHYRLDLWFPMTARYIEGTAGISCRSQIDGLEALSLDCVELTVEEVRRDGFILTHWSVEEGKLVIDDLETTFSAGDSFDIAVSYHGTPEYGFYYYPANSTVPETTAFTITEPWDSRRWFPCFDEPWDKADYGCQINATVPLGYQVASNGLLTEVDTTWTRDQFTATYRWRESHPIATYLMSVAISKYAILFDQYVTQSGDTIPIQHFVYHPDTAAAAINFSCVPDMMAHYSSLFGEYPFAKYGMATTPWGGMEHQTITTIFRSAALNNVHEDVIAHELAHQWWGDLVTCANWPSLWLNEGFATYFEALWMKHRYGESSFWIMMNYFAQSYFDEDEIHRIPIL